MEIPEILIKSRLNTKVEERLVKLNLAAFYFPDLKVLSTFFYPFTCTFIKLHTAERRHIYCWSSFINYGYPVFVINYSQYRVLFIYNQFHFQFQYYLMTIELINNPKLIPSVISKHWLIIANKVGWNEFINSIC